MTLDSLRTHCLSLAHVTEKIQWEDDILFCIGGKMFAVACLDLEVPHRVSFKCDPEAFAELVERDGIIPAPYLARHHWVTLERFDALPDADIRRRVEVSYDRVLAKLPARVRRDLEGTTARRARRAPST